jgi:hypothetical protein
LKRGQRGDRSRKEKKYGVRMRKKERKKGRWEKKKNQTSIHSKCIGKEQNPNWNGTQAK